MDGVDAVGRELRQGIGAELRADAEETERLVALAARRRRTLADVAADLRSRGDTVAVDVPGARFTGVVVHAGTDVLRLRTAATPVDVRLSAPVAVTVVERAASGGSDPVEAPATFRARLLELELAGVEVELGGTVGTGPLIARLSAVAVDHVVAVDLAGSEHHVAIAALTYVRPR